MLLTEDKEVYVQMLQELVKEYQPATPTEFLYVEKIAMGQLRLYRLWRTEAARANKEMMQRRYPSLSEKGGLNKTWEFGALPGEISGEKLVIGHLIRNLEFDTDSEQVSSRSEDEALSNLLESVTRIGVGTGGTQPWAGQIYGEDDIRCLQTKSAVLSFREWLTPPENDAPGDEEDEEEAEEYVKPDHVELEVALEKASQLLVLLQRRLGEVESEEQSFVQNNEVSKGIVQDPELLTRYERHINRQLRDDIEMLRTLKNDRRVT
jgi:hypothetical protein